MPARQQVMYDIDCLMTSTDACDSTTLLHRARKMKKLSLLALAAIPVVAMSRPAAPPVVVNVESGSRGTAAIRVVATGGTITSGGKTYPGNNDTLRLVAPVRFTSTEPVVMATFIADDPNELLRASDGERQASGPMVIVVRMPGETRFSAMAVPSELQLKRP
jgi:hypothetical protein